jgi:hypothetical protein
VRALHGNSSWRSLLSTKQEGFLLEWSGFNSRFILDKAEFTVNRRTAPKKLTFGTAFGILLTRLNSPQ